MTTPPLRALLIAHEPDGPARHIETRLRERGFETTTHIVTPDIEQPNEATPWPDFSEFDLVVPMGSIRSLTNKEEIDSWIHDEIRMLRDTHDRGTPILGVCFGAQVMTEALGGTVERAPTTELGWFEIEAAPGAHNPVGPGPWKEWHHDRCLPPADVEVLAVNENAVQMFRQDSTVCTQFHPEVDAAHIDAWLAVCTDEYLADNDTDRDTVAADMAKHEARNIEQCHALVDWFLDDVAFPTATAAAEVSA